MPEKKKILLIDAMNIIFRAYYAFIKNPLRNSKGENTSALYGFTNMVLKLLDEEKPDYVAVVFDSPTPTFRKQLYPEYKANREEPPDELVQQIPKVQHLCDILALPRIEQEGLEADDCIATLADEAEKRGFEVSIASSDKDLYQLVDKNTHLITTKKGINDIIKIDVDGVIEKLGVKPEQVTDFLALTGDKSDNIPGVKGIGEKTAANLLNAYNNLDYIIENIDKIEPKTVANKIKDDMDNLLISRELVKLKYDLPIRDEFNRFRPSEADEKEVKRFLQDMEFTSLLDRFIKPREHKKLEYKEIGLKDVLNKITKGDWAIEVEDGYIALSGPGESYIVNVCPDDMGEALKSIVKANANISGHNLKKIYKKYPSLTDSNIRFFMDIELGAYLITPEGVSYGLESIYFREFGERLDDYTGQPELFIEKESLIKNIVSRAGAIFRLIKPIKDKLDSAGLTGVLKDIEMPLTPVLARMENRGVLIDSGILADLSKSVQTKIEEMEERIYSEVGERFNIASPKQLSKILFDKLGLPTQRKTKTGYSTDSEVLETLSKMHPVPRMIIEHRTLSKMKSSYIDALPTYINKDTGRIHTTFLQTSTSTGRLSSRDPNLQNIPIRTEIGSQIRQAFIAPDDRLLLSADYSQIELRILAHMSGDENLIEAFKRNEDIHTRTAKEIFPGAEIDGELRRRAKAVNFGLIYGKTPHGLSQELGISHEEASEYIEKYFSRFPAVREFMDTLIKSAHEKGYAETMFGRRRYLPELKSENATIRSSAERAALNMPIQGTAADIMKMVMIEIEKTLSKTEYGFMILTIHDELLFEVMENKIEEVKDLVKDKMEGIIKLAMPVVVDIGWGKNWLEAH